MEEDDDLDDEDDSGFSTAPDDDDPFVPCPHCGTDIYDEAEQCPACGQYLSREDEPARPKPWWIVLGVAICLVIVILWMLSA